MFGLKIMFEVELLGEISAKDLTKPIFSNYVMIRSY